MKYKILIVLVWVFSNLNAQTQAELALRKTVTSFNSDTADLFAKRDTNKFANGIRASIYQDTVFARTITANEEIFFETLIIKVL